MTRAARFGPRVRGRLRPTPAGRLQAKVHVVTLPSFGGCVVRRYFPWLVRPAVSRDLFLSPWGRTLPCVSRVLVSSSSWRMGGSSPSWAVALIRRLPFWARLRRLSVSTLGFAIYATLPLLAAAVDPPFVPATGSGCRCLGSIGVLDLFWRPRGLLPCGVVACRPCFPAYSPVRLPASWRVGGP